MTLSYVLHRAGWATATTAHSDSRHEMRVSYLSDPLADMARAAIGLLEGAASVRYAFADEPGEHRCIVTRISDREALIRVLWFDDLWSGLPDERGAEVFNCTCAVARFCGEVLACLQCLLDEHGLDGYKELWCSNEFPSELHERLRRLIDERRRHRAMAPGKSTAPKQDNESVDRES